MSLPRTRYETVRTAGIALGLGAALVIFTLGALAGRYSVDRCIGQTEEAHDAYRELLDGGRRVRSFVEGVDSVQHGTARESGPVTTPAEDGGN